MEFRSLEILYKKTRKGKDRQVKYGRSSSVWAHSGVAERIVKAKSIDYIRVMTKRVMEICAGGIA